MGIFSETIAADLHSKKIRPLVFKLNSIILMDKVLDFLNEQKYEIDLFSKDYREIHFFDGSVEYTFSFVDDGNSSIMQIILFTTTKKFSKKKLLLAMIDKVKKCLGDYLL